MTACGQADALKAHGADIVVTDLAELLDRLMISQADVHRRAVVPARDHAGPGHAGPDGVGVRAVATGTSAGAGNLDEGEPHGLPGTYLNGVYETRPLPYAEAAYGLPESGQTVINVTNGKLIRLFVDDEPFDVRYGELRAHERVLDFRTGPAQPPGRMGVTGRAESVRVSPRPGWCRSPSGRSPRSATRWSRWTDPARIAVQSELLANEQLPVPVGDPRLGAVLDHPLAGGVSEAAGSGRGAGAHDQAQRAARSAPRWIT